MFNSIRAKLRKLADVTLEDLGNLLGWASGIDLTNRNLLIASATDEKGTAAYLAVEPTWILNGYAFRPQLSDARAGDAGDSIYSTVEREAKAHGVGKVLIVLPNEVPAQPDEKCLRVIELKLPTQQIREVVLPDVRANETPSAWIN